MAHAQGLLTQVRMCAALATAVALPWALCVCEASTFGLTFTDRSENISFYIASVAIIATVVSGSSSYGRSTWYRYNLPSGKLGRSRCFPWTRSNKKNIRRHSAIRHRRSLQSRTHDVGIHRPRLRAQVSIRRRLGRHRSKPSPTFTPGAAAAERDTVARLITSDHHHRARVDPYGSLCEYSMYSFIHRSIRFAPLPPPLGRRHASPIKTPTDDDDTIAPHTSLPVARVASMMGIRDEVRPRPKRPRSPILAERERERERVDRSRRRIGNGRRPPESLAPCSSASRR